MKRLLSSRPVVALAGTLGASYIRLVPATSRIPDPDDTDVNLPFSMLGIVVGDPIWVAADADDEALEVARLAVERGLNEVTARPTPSPEPPTPCQP